MNESSKDVMVMVRSQLADVHSFSGLLSAVEFGVFGLNRGLLLDPGDAAPDTFARLERDEHLIYAELATWFAARRAALLTNEQFSQPPTSSETPAAQQARHSVMPERQPAHGQRPTSLTLAPREQSYWQQQIATATLKVAAELPKAPVRVARLTMLILLGYRAAGFRFILPSEADLLGLYYWPLISAGLMVEPKWIHDPTQKNKPLTNLVNSHPGAMARVVIDGEVKGSKTFGFGTTSSGVELYTGFLVDTGLSLSRLNQFTTELAATVSVPVDYRAEFLQDPDLVPLI